MSERSLEELIERLDSSRASLLQGMDVWDLDVEVNPTSGWRVKDVLCHIAQWERLVAQAFEAHRLGIRSPVFEPFDIHAINERIRALHAEHTRDRVVQLLDQTRASFLFALTQVPRDETVMMPWGRTGTPLEKALDMHNHECHHTQQIIAACARA